MQKENEREKEVNDLSHIGISDTSNSISFGGLVCPSFLVFKEAYDEDAI